MVTVALAIAIGHDDRPIKRALHAIDWTTCPAAGGHPALARFKLPSADKGSVTAETQKALWPTDRIPMGYLDLVLNVHDSPLGNSAIWVEVKVDAEPSGVQLEVYKQHAALLQTPPAVITLARTKVVDCVPFLKWSDVVAAIDEIPAAHHAWLSLRDFLLDYRIVRRPPPTKPVDDPDACIEVILDINRRLRQLWPKTTLFWMDGALRRSLKISFEAHHDLVTSGGPLRYGLMPAGDGWDWGLVVTARKSVYQKVALDVQQMVRDANVLDQYFAGLTTGQDTVVESAQLPEEDGEDG